MNDSRAEVQQVCGAIPMSQVAELCKKVVPGKLKISQGNHSFIINKNDGGEGIASIRGSLSGDIISISIEVLRTCGEMKVPLAFLFSGLIQLGDNVKLIPRPTNSPASSLWIGFGVKASPINYTRSSIISQELERIEKFAKGLQAYLPAQFKDNDLEKKYEPFKGTLAPVYPWKAENPGDGETLRLWAAEVLDVLLGSASVAITATHPIALNLAGSVLAEAMQNSGSALGTIIAPAVPSKSLVEIAMAAPGFVMAHANRLSLGAGIYELGNEIRSLLAALADMDKPVIFAGAYSQLQSLFHGGQGGEANPLLPVICRVPDVSLDALVGFSIHTAGRLAGGISVSAERDLSALLFASLQELSPHDRQRVLPAAAKRMVKYWASGQQAKKNDISGYAAKMSRLSETLSGLCLSPRSLRAAEVQERFMKVLTGPELLPFLKSRLLGQDRALEQLALRLSTECLTRPLHQPLCYCAQGTPGTGKSESTALLAERLGVPLVHIDAASIPDFHTGAAQLLGSGRGIVGSYQSGRLEQAAKHHSGVVIEVSDLDHANPSVRSYLADLFLQVLEVGEATSAMGATFSCANAIFAFTLNLPNGMDERIHRGIGFENTPTSSNIAGKVAAEIKGMLSSAFLSRVGRPILFDPLRGETLGRIIEQAIAASIPTAAERLGQPIGGIEVVPGTGMKLMASLNSSIISFGARLLIQEGRFRAGDALKMLCRSGVPIGGRILIVECDSNELVISIKGDKK